MSFQVFEHLSKPEAYFRFCRAACASSGSVVIFTPNRARLSNRLRARQGLAPELLDPQHFKEYTADEIVELGRRAGFISGSYFGYGLFGNKWIDRLPNRCGCVSVAPCINRVGYCLLAEGTLRQFFLFHN